MKSMIALYILQSQSWRKASVFPIALLLFFFVSLLSRCALEWYHTALLSIVRICCVVQTSSHIWGMEINVKGGWFAFPIAIELNLQQLQSLCTKCHLLRCCLRCRWMQALCRVYWARKRWLQSKIERIRSWTIMDAIIVSNYMIWVVNGCWHMGKWNRFTRKQVDDWMDVRESLGNLTPTVRVPWEKVFKTLIPPIKSKLNLMFAHLSHVLRRIIHFVVAFQHF